MKCFSCASTSIVNFESVRGEGGRAKLLPITRYYSQKEKKSRQVYLDNLYSMPLGQIDGILEEVCITTFHFLWLTQSRRTDRVFAQSLQHVVWSDRRYTRRGPFRGIPLPVVSAVQMDDKSFSIFRILFLLFRLSSLSSAAVSWV